jgi:hypothetical protein
MWAEDCIVMATTQAGLQLSMDRTFNYFTSLGLVVNYKKTKVILFNSGGFGTAKFPKFEFYINNQLNLGFVFKSSGLVAAGIKEHATKANRAYYSISNILYERKNPKVDVTVLPVAMYALDHLVILNFL